MAKELTSIRIKNAPDGKLFDGDGLTLIKKGSGGKWVYRYSHLKKRREMGIGAYPAVSLADARKIRDRWARELMEGRDPIEVRKAEQDAAIAERDKRDPTFEEITRIVFEARKETLKGDGARGRWLSPLITHVFPRIGQRRLSDLHQKDIADALAPIWKTKHPTAIKALRRIKIVFDEAELMGYECEERTVRAAQRILGHHRHTETPIASTRWQDVPALYERIDLGNIGGRCLAFTILTLGRLDAVRGARYSEIDGDVWTIPAERMKGRDGFVSDFRVPLSREALRIAEICRDAESDMLFPGLHRRGPISDRAVEKVLDKMGEEGRPHGFRASFRTWTEEADAAPWDVAETILAHNIKGSVERSYARSDLLERRRPVMEAWAGHVTGAAGNVVKLAR